MVSAYVRRTGSVYGSPSAASWHILSYLSAEQDTYSLINLASATQNPAPPRRPWETYGVPSFIYYLESPIDFYNFSWVRSLVIHGPHILFHCFSAGVQVLRAWDRGSGFYLLSAKKSSV